MLRKRLRRFEERLEAAPLAPQPARPCTACASP